MGIRTYRLNYEVVNNNYYYDVSKCTQIIAGLILVHLVIQVVKNKLRKEIVGECKCIHTDQCVSMRTYLLNYEVVYNVDVQENRHVTRSMQK